MSIHSQMLARDLQSVLADAEKVLRTYGLKSWRLTLVVRNPGHDGQHVITTDDDTAAVADLLRANP